MQSRIIFLRCLCLAVLLGCVEANRSQTIWTKLADTGGSLTSGNYQIQDDNLTVKSSIIIKNNQTVTIDMNGYVLSATTNVNVVLHVENGGKLTIIDTKDTAHQGNLNTNVYNILDWPLTGGNINFNGGTIYNDYINENTDRKGILVEGDCFIEGVNIMGCYSTKMGAAVTVSSSGQFKMTGGKISYNYSAGAEYAGIVYGEPKNANASGAIIDFENTTISHNSVAGYGGAICAYKVYLDNCLIEHNTALLNGGGLYIRGIGLELNISGNTKIQYNKALGIVDENSKKIKSGQGGGIYISSDETGNCTIENSIIHSNYASVFGGGIYSQSNTTITNSAITGNLAMYSEIEGQPSYNSGRGGGFYFAGKEIGFLLTNTNVAENASMQYGGGGQICSGGTLTIEGNTTINNNEAVLAGAGGIHVTNDATLNLESGEISYNVAYADGGAIHSSYSCKLNFRGGLIKGNKAFNRGGGVHVNTGGNLKLQGTDIIENEVAKRYKKKYATVDIDNYTYYARIDDSSGFSEDTGYGGGVLIDAGTCTMTAGRLNGNKAEVGGGAIGLVMINMPAPDNAHFEKIMVVEFNLIGGEIKNNETKGDGGGVYVMENKIGPELLELSKNGGLPTGFDLNSEFCQGLLNGVSKANIEGGILADNIATGNGGALLVNGNVTVTDGQFIDNIASGYGGAIYVKEGKVQLNNINILHNKAEQNGGGLHLEAGELVIGSHEENTIERNTAINGAGISITNGTLTIGKCTIKENKAELYGGGLYVNNETETLNQATFNGGDIMNNTARAGGGVAVNGYISLFVNKIGIYSNTAINGGGIYLHSPWPNRLASMSFGQGMIYNNTAIATTSMNGLTAYHVSESSVNGVGGGIFMDNNSKLSFNVEEVFGLYGNTAQNAADDIFTNGVGTILELPEVSDMHLTDFNIPAGELFWTEDYPENDIEYRSGLNGISSSVNDPAHNLRYDYSLYKLKRAHIVKVQPEVLTDIYACITLGYEIFIVTLQVNGLMQGESAVFNVISSKQDPEPYLTLTLTGTNDDGTAISRKMALPDGTWRVELVNPWTWTYTTGESSITKQGITDETVFDFSLTKKSDSTEKDEKLDKTEFQDN